MSIYSLKKLSFDIEQQLIESQGVVTNELDLWLQSKESELRSNVDLLLTTRSRLKAAVPFYKDKIKELRAIVDGLELAYEKLTANTKQYMQAEGLGELRGEHHKAKLVAQGTKLVIDNEDMIPKEYLKEVVSWELDKKLIKNLLEKGVDIPGCRLEPILALRESLIRKELE